MPLMPDAYVCRKTVTPLALPAGSRSALPLPSSSMGMVLAENCMEGPAIVWFVVVNVQLPAIAEAGPPLLAFVTIAAEAYAGSTVTYCIKAEMPLAPADPYARPNE